MIVLQFLTSYQPISAPVLFKMPTPGQINLIKNAKNNFLVLKNTESAQLCFQAIPTIKEIYLWIGHIKTSTLSKINMIEIVKDGFFI